MPPQPNITPSSTYCAVKDQVTCELSGEAVILHLGDGVYYGLDPVGASIWKLLETPRTIPEIRDAIVEEYEVTPEQCEADLRKLLEELVAKNLVVVGLGDQGTKGPRD